MTALLPQRPDHLACGQGRPDAAPTTAWPTHRAQPVSVALTDTHSEGLSFSDMTPGQMLALAERLFDAVQFVDQVDPDGEHRLCVTLTTSDPDLLAVLERARQMQDGKRERVLRLLEQTVSTTQGDGPITEVEAGHN